jgi:AAHS family 4-hydroxybenzoate transporter-like MFS transporter
MIIRGMLGGLLGDRIGRRTTLLLSVLSFAVFTLAIATVNTVMMLGLLRFLAGLGLGGAMPNAAALASEYVPKRQRPFAVTLTIVCIPLGGTLAGFVSGYVLPLYGWRTLFVIGGVIPIALALALFKALPESPRFLARYRERWPELATVLRRIGHKVPADAAFVESATANQGKTSASIGDLFAHGRARDTLGLMGSFLFCLLANYYAIFLLVPTMTAAGFTQADASNSLGWWNLGGVGGAILGALVIQKLGSRITMLGMTALSIACTLVLAVMRLAPDNILALTAMFIITGGLMNAVQTTMYALAANVYPTEIRGTGIGTAVAVGRIGNVAASFVANYALDKGGVPGYFLTFSITMGIVFLSLAVISRHVERAGQPVVAGAH